MTGNQVLLFSMTLGNGQQIQQVSSIDKASESTPRSRDLYHHERVTRCSCDEFDHLTIDEQDAF